MKNKEFEAKVLVICIALIAITIGLGIVFNKSEGNKIELDEQANEVLK